jgi:hypothetical protein
MTMTIRPVPDSPDAADLADGFGSVTILPIAALINGRYY